MKDKYKSDFIKHFIYLELFGNEISSSIVQEMKDFEEELEALILEKEYIVTKDEVNEVKKKITDNVSSFVAGIELSLLSQVKNLSRDEAKWLVDNIKESTGKTLDIPKNLDSMIEYVPYSSSNTIQSFLNSLKLGFNNLYQRILRTSYVFSQKNTDVLNSVQPQLNAINRNVETNVQTMVTSVGKLSHRLVYSSNYTNIHYIWTSMLDSSTCLVCGNLHGTKYDGIKDVPFYPVHERCRCMLLPDTEENRTELISYKDWIAEQPEETQRKILGKTRYELYKGGMKIKEFVKDNRKLTLDELYLD